MSSTETSPIVRTVASTQSEMTEIILPNDANTLGIFSVAASCILLT